MLLAANFYCQAQASAADRIRVITSALRTGRFDQALELLQPELQQNPNNAQLWTLKGLALSGIDNKKDALAAFRRALGISPDYLPALEGAAQIEYDNGDDAAPWLQRVLRLRPDDATSHAMLGVLAYRRHDCVRAVSHFDRSGSLVDSQPAALQEYGDCLLRLQQTEKAIVVFKRALAQPNADDGARRRLAYVQLIARHPNDAIATLQPSLRDNPSDAGLLELAASAYEADGNTPDAVRILRRAIVVDPHNVNLYLDFTIVCLDHQSYEVGVDVIDSGIVAEPKAARLYVARGVLYVQLAQYDKAEADFETADALDPHASPGSAAEGLAAVQENDPDRALATVRSKLAKAPNDAFLLYLQADLLTQRGPSPGSAEFREAVVSARRSASLRPSHTSAHDLLAKLYLQAGENEEAIAECRKALSIDPRDQTALYHLIQALRKSGQTNEIPGLLKQLADLRMTATKEEAARNRYKLVEEDLRSTEKP